jgi:chromosome partitioning protein
MSKAKSASKAPAAKSGPAKVIACCIHKGGTGKTTIAVHLAHFLASRQKRVLMVDCDTQGNATQIFIEDDSGLAGSSQLFTKQGSKAVVHQAEGSNVLVMPADEDLTEIDSLRDGEEYLFRDNLRAVAAKHQVDYVVIDTPPTLNMGMLAPLVASDFAFSPFKPDPFCFRGISSLTKRIEQIRAQHNPELAFLGLLINLWNRRNSDHNAIVEALKESQSEHIIPYMIGDRAAIARVAFSRTPVWSHHTGAAGVASKEMRAALSWIVDQMEAA